MSLTREGKSLGELFGFKNGRSFKKSEWREIGLPIIRIQNLNDSSKPFNRFKGDYDPAIEVNEGDLLFSWSGTVGSSFGPHIWDRETGVLNQHIFKLSFKEQTNVRYAYYALQQITAEIERSVRGAVGLVHVTKTDLKKFVIPHPSKAEQKRIVAILDEAFQAIDRAKEIAERNLANARELFESYLNRVFTEKGEGWEKLRLADLNVAGRIITYGVIKLGDVIPGGVPCLRTSNVKKLKIDLAGMKRIARSLSESYGRTILKGGEVLVNVRGTLGGVAVVPEEMCGWNVSREVAVVPVNSERIEPSFAALWIAAKNQQDWLTGVKKGAAYTGINIEDLRRLPMCFPSRSEQNRLVVLLDAAKTNCRNLESSYRTKLASLDELKQSILQKAFTGRLSEKSPELEMIG